jgi:glucose-1-phosphate cytidylyltransferase
MKKTHLPKAIMDRENIPVVILAGGLGTRLREETEYKPKPMVEVGYHPILWHIMKTYSSYGFNNFYICAGYKKETIQDYFLNFNARSTPFSVKLNEPGSIKYHDQKNSEPWNVTVVDTGELTNTGGRIWQLKEFIGKQRFFCTYGDGLSDVNINKLLDFHIQNQKTATLTAVKPQSRFGILDINKNGAVEKFSEKPEGDTWINGGYFVFEPEIFNELSENIILEREPLEKLVVKNSLSAFKHTGFWQHMDTFREFKLLNEMWETNKAPWKVWE